MFSLPYRTPAVFSLRAASPGVPAKVRFVRPGPDPRGAMRIGCRCG